MIQKPVKKLEKLFIAPEVRQVLYETAQRVFHAVRARSARDS
jgi:hypothetical protein